MYILQKLFSNENLPNFPDSSPTARVLSNFIKGNFIPRFKNILQCHFFPLPSEFLRLREVFKIFPQASFPINPIMRLSFSFKL